MTTNNTLRELLLATVKEHETTLSRELEASAVPVHIFSRQYKKRKRKQLRGMRLQSVRQPFRKRKKLILVLAVLLIMLFSAFSVQAIREPIIRFFMEITQISTNFFIRTDPSDMDTGERKCFTLSYIPDGFKLVETIKDDSVFIEIYMDDEGNSFNFGLQYYDHSINFSMDTEDAEVTETTIHGKYTVISAKEKGVIIAVFDEESDMVWSGGGEISQDEMVKIVENAKAE